MAKSKIRHMQVIRLSAMGDVAMTVPVLLALTEKYPDVKITFLTKPFFAPIVSEIPNIKVFIADVKGAHKGVLGLWKLFKQLKSLDVDAVADIHNVLRSNVLKVFFRFSGIPFEQLDKGRKEKRELTSGKNKELKPLKPMYQRYQSVFERLGFHFPINNDHVLKSRNITTEFACDVFSDAKKVIGIAPFAAFPGKIYPLDFMETLIADLSAIEDVKIVLFGGGQNERTILEGWEGKFANCISAAGKISFKEELELISNLDVMISMDSGNGHLAAMYGVPVITLWGVTHPVAGFVPFGQPEENQITSDRKKYPLIPTSVYGNKIPPGYELVMETLVPEQIVTRALQILEKV
ncbi:MULTISPECIES: glycosyltransferase family 9 protein [Maribacter]|uniref:Glycosyltransferase family 9 protein n=1 Tax=Maribacter flavus TaxID=1658664 RepID=A0ABU7IF33_9FLAO|nr:MULTISPECIES: glycosyltransferase family 9 protein [Maribacter]MDC6404170.1 glycosyltransferase family 9 protein [Maribacter sp. PR66]MEE1971313.1 glycosyltransferase family 9 protein [Maribacter flavus]